MIYTRILLDDDEIAVICAALNRYVDDTPPMGDMSALATDLRRQIKDAHLQTQRIRENEKAGVK